MNTEKNINILNLEGININVNDERTVENIIAKILSDDNFNKLNLIQNNQNCNQYNNIKTKFNLFENNPDIEFFCVNNDAIAPYCKTISKKEFYRIIGKTKNGISKKSGKYQQKLYGYFKQAEKEADGGFLFDVLNDAAIFDQNLNYIQTLVKNKKFMNEWRKNFGQLSPVKEFKRTGNMKKINMVKENIK